jgi:hypothetical protein
MGWNRFVVAPCHGRAAQKETEASYRTMTTFAELKLEDIKRIAAPAGNSTLKVNQDLYEGDHWRNAQGWVGPLPPTPGETDEDRDAVAKAHALVMGEIQRGFVSENIIAEAIDRHAGGVIGRVPTWMVTLVRPVGAEEKPTQEESDLIAEADAALTRWWDEHDLHEELRQMTTTLLWATLDKRNEAGLQLFVPPAYFTDPQTRTLPKAKSIDEALSRLWAECAPAGALRMVTDPLTMQKAGLYAKQVTPLGATAPNTVYELSYLDDKGNTVVKVWHVGEAEPQPATAPLGGALLHHVATRPVFFGESVRRLQYALNKSLSMMSHNENVAGFVERTVINANIPDGLQFGPLMTNFLVSETVEDADGNERALPTSVIYREPSPPDTFARSQHAYRMAILLQVWQLHALLSDDGTTSGESRRQALADYLASLLVTAPAVAMAGRWLLTTALRMGAFLMGSAGRYDSLRVDFTPRLYVGPVPADEMRVVLEMVEGGLLSQEDGMSRIGVDDPAAMRTAIRLEHETGLERKKVLAEILRDLWKPYGAKNAAKFSGATDEELKDLTEGLQEATTTAPPLPADAAGDEGAGDGDGNEDDNGDDASQGGGDE